MKYKLALAAIALTGLTGCELQRDGPDWTHDCMRNHSETDRQMGKCQERRKAHQHMPYADGTGAGGVDLTRYGPDTNLSDEGKNSEPREQNSPHSP